MKIIWLQDLDPCCNVGGGQLNDWSVIRKGIERSHNISVITPQNMDAKGLDGADLVIISNCVSFPQEYIKNVCAKYPYIFFHHDFNFYTGRLYYPMEKNNFTNCNRELWLPLYQNAKLHIWLSP